MVKKISRLLQAGSIFSLVLLHFTFVSCKSLSGKFSGTKVWGDEDGPNMPPPPPPPTPPITPNAQTSSSTSASTFSPTTEPYRVRVLNVIFKLPSDENRSTHPAETLINELKLELEKASSKNGITQMNDGNWYLYHTQEVIFDFAPYIYLNALPIPEKDPSDPTKFNYTQFIQDQGLCRNIKNTFDEVWLWANDTAGFYESRMVGPSGQIFRVNSPPIENTVCDRPFIIMGFNTQSGVPSALHSYGHRMEDFSYKAFDGNNIEDKDFAFKSTIGPSHLTYSFWGNNLYASVTNRPAYRSCGNVHYPPNNRNTNNAEPYAVINITEAVKSDCYNWTASNSEKIVDVESSDLIHDLSCTDWQCTELGFMKWWLNQLPNACSSQDIRNNGKVKNIWAFAFGKTEPRTCNFRKLCNPEGFTNGLKLGDDVNYCRSDIGIGAPPILFPETPIDGIEQQKLECIAINGKAHWACIDNSAGP